MLQQNPGMEHSAAASSCVTFSLHSHNICCKDTWQLRTQLLPAAVPLQCKVGGSLPPLLPALLLPPLPPCRCRCMWQGWVTPTPDMCSQQPAADKQKHTTHTDTAVLGFAPVPLYCCGTPKGNQRVKTHIHTQSQQESASKRQSMRNVVLQDQETTWCQEICRKEPLANKALRGGSSNDTSLQSTQALSPASPQSLPASPTPPATHQHCMKPAPRPAAAGHCCCCCRPPAPKPPPLLPLLPATDRRCWRPHQLGCCSCCCQRGRTGCVAALRRRRCCCCVPRAAAVPGAVAAVGTAACRLPPQGTPAPSQSTRSPASSKNSSKCRCSSELSSHDRRVQPATCGKLNALRTGQLR